MATSRTAETASAVSETLYRTLVWLDVRLGLLFAVGLPLVLVVWAASRRQGAILRLLGLYWKVASLLFIALLLLVGNQAIGYALVLLVEMLVAALALVLLARLNLRQFKQDTEQRLSTVMALELG